jgi:hypothetical protein
MSQMKKSSSEANANGSPLGSNVNNGQWKLSRRTMLKGAGALLGLPLLDAMMPSLMAGEGTTPVSSPAGGAGKAPVRAAFIFMPNGVNKECWLPQGRGRDYQLSPTLKPLEALKPEFSVLTELWNAGTNTGDGHYFKDAAWLTGTTITRTTGSDLRCGGVSVDQLAAQRIGNLTPLPSLELGTEPVRSGVDVNVGITQLYGGHISWSTPTTPVAKEIKPRLAFDRLFRPKERAPGQNAADDKSVLDWVLNDAKSLRNRIGQTDKLKLDEYLDSVRAVEKRIEFETRRRSEAVQMDPLARAEIEKLNGRIDGYDNPGKMNNRKDGSEHTEHCRLMMDLIVLAFWTDSTRVGSFMFGNAVSGRNFSFLEGVNGGHHQISHHENDKKKLEEYAKINLWHVEQYAYMIEKMKKIKEGSGTLLDNSMVLFGSGFRDGNAHDPHNLPLLLAGKGGGTIAQGRHIYYAKNSQLCNLYVSMLNRLGVPTEHFGDSTGELAGINDANFTGDFKG